ncbi:uncharacterized protein RJT21DRAFT_54842 [Scheffersomyces amazonensis]|uniref:uncharacterized protein n=1 Tax=Scheffersomyces amazonensis TaxID=1078765 RepID=UPI00315D1321
MQSRSNLIKSIRRSGDSGRGSSRSSGDRGSGRGSGSSRGGSIRGGSIRGGSIRGGSVGGDRGGSSRGGDDRSSRFRDDQYSRSRENERPSRGREERNPWPSDSNNHSGAAGSLKVHPDRLKQVPAHEQNGRRDDSNRGFGNKRGDVRERNNDYNQASDYRKNGDDRRVPTARTGGFEKATESRNGRWTKITKNPATSFSKVQDFLTDIDSISNVDAVEVLKSRLSKVESYPTLDQIKIIDSGWGVKTKGFEEVSAQRAKLSGLFPLPGYPRPVDYTKLEGVINDRLAESDNLLRETSKIDPIDSKNSKTLIFGNINFDQINYLKLVDNFSSILKSIDIEESSTFKVEKKKFTKDNNHLIVEFSNHLAATIISSFNGLELSFNKFKEDSEPFRDDSLTFTISIERPKEYVVQTLLPAYEEISLDKDIEEIVLDSPRKITIKVNTSATETLIIQELKKIAPIKAFQLLREIGTKESLGIGFIEFYIEPKEFTTLDEITNKIQEYINKSKEIEIINDAFFSCIIPFETSIQDCVIEMDTLTKLATNELVKATPKSSVIQLLNMFNPKDLSDDAKYQFFKQDIYQEVIRFGEVKSIKFPRPATDFLPGLSQFKEPGLGKIFIEFEDESVALQAIVQLAGRTYNDRTVLAGYFSYDDYQKGII